MRDFIRTIAFLVMMGCVLLLAVGAAPQVGAFPELATMPDAGVLLIGVGVLVLVLFIGASLLRDAISTRDPGDIALLIFIVVVVIICLIPE